MVMERREREPSTRCIAALRTRETWNRATCCEVSHDSRSIANSSTLAPNSRISLPELAPPDPTPTSFQAIRLPAEEGGGNSVGTYVGIVFMMVPYFVFVLASFVISTRRSLNVGSVGYYKVSQRSNMHTHTSPRP